MWKQKFEENTGSANIKFFWTHLPDDKGSKTLFQWLNASLNEDDDRKSDT